MNVQNALAATAAAFAAGAPLHDIRQGLRSFTTSYYLSPGRLNEIDVGGVTVIVDYCHNPPGMRLLGDFVDRLGDSLVATHELGKPSRIGMIAAAGDRRDDSMRELGRIAADHFDVIVVREDISLRGRRAGETAELVADGARAGMNDGGRCKQVEIVPDEIAAVRHCWRGPTPVTWSCCASTSTRSCWPSSSPSRARPRPAPDWGSSTWATPIRWRPPRFCRPEVPEFETWGRQNAPSLVLSP